MNNNINMYRTSSKIHYKNHMIKEFTPPGLCLLGPASNAFSLSIMLKIVNTSIYNAQKAGKHVPMAPECPKMPV